MNEMLDTFQVSQTAWEAPTGIDSEVEAFALGAHARWLPNLDGALGAFMEKSASSQRRPNMAILAHARHPPLGTRLRRTSALKGMHFVWDTSSMLESAPEALVLLCATNTVIIPYVTISELDSQNKTSTKPNVKQQAKALRETILNNLTAFRLQTHKEVATRVSENARCNDDHILSCAVYFSDQQCRPLYLVTEDRFLRIKAAAEGVSVVDVKELAALR